MTGFHQLVGGFRHFRREFFLKEQEFFDRLAHGQNPKTLVVACCDSRTDPAIVLGCKPGDLFVVRSIAAIVPPEDKAGEHDAVVAALEYGVKHLQIENIVIMGHSNCGGIHGLFHPEKLLDSGYVGRWVSLACPALVRINEENPEEPESARERLCEEASVLLSIENLLTYSWIEEAVNDSRLALHALYYDMRAGCLLVWNAQKEDFEPLSH
ncbi:MAG TPA: carbonic anhydrase [Candidatus Aphodousia gallistercoris]|nr:carbonic anhydrase [Candidatus Aphodousia gallistercoris]